jgi:hypothetical protein
MNARVGFSMSQAKGKTKVISISQALDDEIGECLVAEDATFSAWARRLFVEELNRRKYLDSLRRPAEEAR